MADTDPDKGSTATMDPPKNKGGRPPLKRPLAVDGTDIVDKPEDGAPKLGDDVFYVLDVGPNKGERRAAKIVNVWPTGPVLMVFPGRHNDFKSAEQGLPTTMPERSYDADGAPGTWHRDGDPASFKE